MPDADRSVYPHNVARSTGTECDVLLASMLAAQVMIDEIFNAEDFSPFENYIIGRGRPNAEGRITCGIIVWLYPTGLHGPYHETDGGTVEHHGVLFTIERGARMSDVTQRARASLRMGVIVHEHVLPT